MSKIWLITDTHFGHKKLSEVWKSRPEDFEHRIFESMCKSIEPHDTLIHLGDFCIGNDKEWMDKYFMEFFAFYILVKGNHDNKSTHWYTENGFDFVCEGFVARHFGKTIHFTHKPHIKLPGVDINIHGHWHGGDHRTYESVDFYDDEYHAQLALENTGMKVVSLESFLNNHFNKHGKKTS